MNWNNFLVPLFYFVTLAIGSVLELYFPVRHLFPTPWIGVTASILLISGGVFLQVWAAKTFGKMDQNAPTRVIITGPYAYSRNPMFTAWLGIYLGTALGLNSIWLFALFPGLVLYVHLICIRSEEKTMAYRFGDAYIQYIERVRRYF